MTVVWLWVAFLTGAALGVLLMAAAAAASRTTEHERNHQP